MVDVKLIRVEVSNLGHITNTYVVFDENKNAAVIDPGDEAEKIIAFLKENSLKVKYIFITHVHADHIAALDELKEFSGAKIVLNKEDFPKFKSYHDSCADILSVTLPTVNEDEVEFVSNNQKILIGEMDFEFLYTPGHTSGAICIFEKNINTLFTGDTLFSNSYGRCDLPTSSFEKMKESLNKLFNRFTDDTLIYPGHGYTSNFGEAKRRVKLLLAVRRK